MYAEINALEAISDKESDRNYALSMTDFIEDIICQYIRLEKDENKSKEMTEKSIEIKKLSEWIKAGF